MRTLNLHVCWDKSLSEVFDVQFYWNNLSALLSPILSILNLYWLFHARSVRRVYELWFIHST